MSMTSETRLIIKEISHTQEGAQLDTDSAYVYRTSNLTLTTEGRVSAAQLTGEIPVTGGLMPKLGSMCILEATNDDGEFVRVFVGFIFSYSVDRWGVVSFTAYDSIRYLQNPVSGKWIGKEGKDVSEIVRDVVRLCGLPYMADEMDAEYVGVKPIRLMKFAEKGIDVIDEMLEWAQLKATANENDVTTKGGAPYAATRPAEKWVFVDNCGKLVLCTVNQLAYIVLGTTEPPIIGTGRAITEMNMSVGIDDSANQVWLLRAAVGGLSGWKGEDPDNTSVWGPLVYYEKIDNAYCRNDEQMKIRTAIELCTRDCEKRTINITTLGMTGLRAGMLVRINIPWLEDYFGEISKSKLVCLTNVSHTWEEGTHTMSFSAEALPGDIDLEVWKSMVEKMGGDKRKSKSPQETKAETESIEVEESGGFLGAIGSFFGV